MYFSYEKLEPLTIDSLLGIHERFWDLNFKFCFPNDNIQIEAELISIDFSIRKDFSISIITKHMSICKPQNINTEHMSMCKPQNINTDIYYLDIFSIRNYPTSFHA